ncbi:MAG TPA: hypothetical protein VGQ78_10715 [Vicinamibacteria bacterium]|nr:hypothetical protein [Vicinamibacteria bacterium]
MPAVDLWFKNTYWKMYDGLQVTAEGDTVRAVKVVTWNEPLLRADGLGHVVFPDCFVLEGFLQMVAMMFMVQENETVATAALMKVKSARFHRAPRLGDRMIYEARIRRSGAILGVAATARLDDGALVAEADLLEALVPKTETQPVFASAMRKAEALL